MKKLIAALLSVLLILSVMTSTAVVAQEVPGAEQVIDIDALDADTAPDTESYTIVDDGEPLLEVVHVKESGVTAALNDSATNGYYTADFMLPETSYHVYLTGLTQNNVDEIRQAIIESYSEGADFELKNLGFVDAEKTWDNDGDENMCWAASTSNLLTYTGWAAQAGFESADDLFEAFISNFDDAGSNVEYATGWFLNGVAAPQGAQPTAGSGGYLPKYTFSDVTEKFALSQNCAAQLEAVYDRLQNGYGVSLSVNIYNDAGLEGSHAITLWGFVTDTRYPKTSEKFYKSLLTTDSDSDKFFVRDGMDRREADDVMSLYALEPVEQEGVDTYQFHISDQQIARITEATTVVPFSENVPHETSDEAKMDPKNYPDIVLDPFALTDDADSEDTLTVFAPDTTIYYQPYMMNFANADYVGKLALQVMVKDSQGNTVFSKNYFYNQNVTISPSHGMAFGAESIDAALPVGDYTITASFNMDHATEEAYYYNNTRSIAFKIREQYLLGDADGDGEVATLDATRIQRVLARLDKDEDGKISLRGDVNENGTLDLMDVTFLQRYFARMTVLYPIGESRFYD